MDDGLPEADAALFPDAPAAPAVVAAAAYRVLARKYRPQSFDDLIGQEPMVRTLSNAFETGRIPQAWMLTGVRGVGKTTTARILARALNYAIPGRVDRPTVEMPELGLHCQAIMESRHVDIIEMDAASHTGIADIREIIEASRYKPVSARYKVYIIDEVHMLSTSAFNGLLKTLEEPPEHVKFLFATTEIRKVPVTVLSRCQRFDLRRIDADVLVRHLAGICTQEGVTAEPEALAVIARAAEGSVRDALSLLDQAIAHGDGRVEPEAVRAMLGLADRARVVDLFEIVMRGDAGAALAELSAQHAIGADPAVVLTDLAAFVHLVTRLKLVQAAARDASLTEAERVRGTAFAASLPIPVLTRAWQILLKGIAEVQAASRPLAAAEMVLVRLAYASELPTPDEAMRLVKGGVAPGNGRAAAGAAASTGTAASSAASAPASAATTLAPAAAPPAAGGPAPWEEDGGRSARPAGAAATTAPAAATASAPSSRGASSSAAASAAPRSAAPQAGGVPAPAAPGVAAAARAAGPTSQAMAGGRASAAPSPQRRDPAQHPDPVSEPQAPGLASLADVARMAAERRDIKIKFGVERQLRPVRFEWGRIEVEPTADAPASLVGDLGRKLSDWTGTRWVVTVSRGAGNPTLFEAEAQSAARRRDDALGDPLVAAVMARFPGASIVDVRINAPEDDLPPLDGYDMPDMGDPDDLPDDL